MSETRPIALSDTIEDGFITSNSDDVSGGRPIQMALSDAGIPIVEHMTGLDRLQVDGFRLTVAPSRGRSMGSFPVRGSAWLDP